MDLMDSIRNRYSVRNYHDRVVEKEKLEGMLEAASLAPSASNRQEWRFVIVRDKETRRKLMEAAKGQAFVGQAPVVIACCAETDNHVMACGQKCYPIDVAIAIEHMALKATEEGLGTCWVGAFYEDKAREILGIPEHIRVVELLTVGYPAKRAPDRKDRLPLEKIAMYDTWR